MLLDRKVIDNTKRDKTRHYCKIVAAWHQSEVNLLTAQDVQSTPATFKHFLIKSDNFR